MLLDHLSLLRVAQNVFEQSDGLFDHLLVAVFLAVLPVVVCPRTNNVDMARIVRLERFNPLQQLRKPCGLVLWVAGACSMKCVDAKAV